MDNKITLNVEETLKLADNSITDVETIRQIGLITTRNGLNISSDNKNQLLRKIKKGYELYGLYPHVIQEIKI